MPFFRYKKNIIYFINCNTAFILIAALHQSENQQNSEKNDYFNAGVASFRLKILQDHTNYARLHRIIKHDLPGLFVRNGNKFHHSPENGFFAKEDKNDHLEVSITVKVYIKD